MEKQLTGLFLTIEGGEGSGKSTLTKRLKESFEREGKEVITTFEPGATELGAKLRTLLLHVKEEITIAPYAELLLFLADRAQHIQSMIRPALEEGKVVICDRFNDSTIAYQGFARGLDVPHVQELCELVVGSVKPNITLILDIDPCTGLERSRSLAGDDRMEAEDVSFHEALRKGFHWLAEQDRNRYSILDAAKSKDDVYSEAWRIISQHD